MGDQQQTGAGSNQDTPSAPHLPSDHQDQPPPPPTQQQAPPPPFSSAPGHQQQQTPPPPSSPGHQHQQTPPPPPFPTAPGHQHQQTPPPQQNQFCSNCSGSRGRQDDCRQYLENMIPIIINKCKHFSAVFTRSMFSVGSLLMMICTGFGLHLPTILAANVFHCFLINMNPFFLTLFSIWAFHKTVIQKRPLFNMNNWRRNFSTHCHR